MQPINAPVDPVAALQAMQSAVQPGVDGPANLEGVVPADPKFRPDVPPHIAAQTKQWFIDTDALVQRANALWEYREANKTLIPARFNPNDPRRGQTPFELRSGKDNRRVQTPYIYRDSLQTTAMSVPEDMTFKWSERKQVLPAEQPGLPLSTSPNAIAKTFAQTLDIVQANLLEEADWITKLQAFVQDGSVYPCAILKHTFRRDYNTTSLSSTPQTKDASDSTARLESMMRQFAGKSFDKNSAQFATMMDLVKELKGAAEVTQYFGLSLDLVPMDSFGISEEAADLVNIYDAPWMFQDVLMTGSEILSRFKYSTGEDGETYGILESELNGAVAWDTLTTSTDPNARNRASRNKQLTAPRATSIAGTSVSTNSSAIEPKRRRYVVREVWSKREHKVYTLLRGCNHFLECQVPQKTSERWYPFTIYVPNRVPTEIYGVSDLELKRDIQARIHRKRTDEEKARYLAIDRYVYNTTMTESKEIAKLGDIPPGQFKGIALGHGQKLTDSIMPLSHMFKPESYDTTKDERDKDMMGALPAQALGATGQAKFATEVNVASQGASIAVQHRQNIIRRTIDGMLCSIAEVLLQELTLDEVVRIAGPFAIWPEIYSDNEAETIVREAKDRAMQTVAPLVMQAAVADMQNQVSVDPQAIQVALETQAAPVWQQEMIQKYGSTEPMSRSAIFRRLKIKVKSSLLSSLDRQQRIQSMSMLSGALLQMAQAAQASGQQFNPRPMLKNFSLLADEDDSIDEMFPGIPAVALASQQIQQGAAQAGQMKIPGGQPEAQGDQGQKADANRMPPGVEQAQSPGTQSPQEPAPAQV